MPYFVYRISQDAATSAKHLELQHTIDVYKEAKTLARSMRSQLDSADQTMIKIIFADNQQEAEQRLTELREKPILREWEK